MTEGDRLMTLLIPAAISRLLRRVSGHGRRLAVFRGRSELLGEPVPQLLGVLYACQYAPAHEFAVNVARCCGNTGKSYSEVFLARDHSQRVDSNALGGLPALALVFTPKTPGGDFYAAFRMA